MRKPSGIVVPILFLVTLGAASYQGQRVERIHDAERFYRWIVSASTQMRLFGDPGQAPPGEDPAKYLDKELFARLVEATEPTLTDVPVGENDLDKEGNPLPKVVRYTAAPVQEENLPTEELPGDEAAEGEHIGTGQLEIYTDEQRERDAQLWAFALNDDNAALRTDLLGAYRDGRMAAFGTQFGIAGMYEEKGTTVSLANMFFGFRKMAANLVWLEVDRFWHKGQMHRMLPLMKTCVMLDPTFIDAYLLGAWHMAYNATASLEETPWEIREYDAEHEYWVGEKEAYYFFGVDFLKDGIRKNPRSYRLYFDLGYSIYEEKLIDHVNAIKYLDEATRLDHDRWVRRQLYRIQGVNRQFEESKTGWENYLEWQPDNQVAPRFIKLMEGEIIDRDSVYAGYSAVAAEQLAARATERGDAQAAAEWSQKAAEMRARETELFEQGKVHWKAMENLNPTDVDTYAEARSLRIQALELRNKKQYDEAIIALEQARWSSAEFWDTATDLMLELKKEGNLPLLVTDIRFLEREEKQADYIRHMPQSIEGMVYRFNDGTWTHEEYRSEPTTPVEQDSEDLLKLEFAHPEIVPAFRKLDGNIVFKAGDAWYEYRSKEPAKPSKLYMAEKLN